MTSSEPGYDAAPFGPMIETRPALARVRSALADAVSRLQVADWAQLTACAPWRVRDVVAHIVGDDLARLSRSRDGHAPPGPAGGESLATFLHRHNQEWVTAAGCLSPAVLRDLLSAVTPQVLAYWRGADMSRLGESVSWAGPGPAPVWLDCARDFTEYWTHLQQILAAIGWPPLADDDALHKVLDTFLRALPWTLQNAAPGASGSVEIRVPGAAGGSWICAHDAGGWRWTDRAAPGMTTVTIDADVLWRLCTRGIEPAEARRRSDIDGSTGLAEAALRIVSIIR